MPEHVDIAAGEIHVPYNWTYANAAARTGATGFVAGDVGKLARQSDDNSLWILTATTPTWVQVGGGGLTTEQVQDIVGAMFVAGTNTTPDYDDTANTIAIDATTGGAGTPLTQEETRHLIAVYPMIDAGTSMSFLGVSTINADGQGATVKETSGAYSFFQTNGGTNDQAGIENFTCTRGYWSPKLHIGFRTGTLLTNQRVWVGLASAALDQSATPSVHYAAWRYDDAADGTAFWRCCSDNGSGTPEVTASDVAATAATEYDFRVEVTASECKFYSGGVLKATHSTKVPTSSTDIGFFAKTTQTAAPQKQFYFQFLTIFHY